MCKGRCLPGICQWSEDGPLDRGVPRGCAADPAECGNGSPGVFPHQRKKGARSQVSQAPFQCGADRPLRRDTDYGESRLFFFIRGHFPLGTCRCIASKIIPQCSSDKNPTAKSGRSPSSRLNRVIWGRVKTPLRASSMGARGAFNTSSASAQKVKPSFGRIAGASFRSIWSRAESTRGGGEKLSLEMVLIYRK